MGNSEVLNCVPMIIIKELDGPRLTAKLFAVA